MTAQTVAAIKAFTKHLAVFWNDVFSITSLRTVQYKEIAYGNVQEFMSSTKSTSPSTHADDRPK